MQAGFEFLKVAISLAKEAKKKGNLPYGCVLASKEGQLLLTSQNTVVTDHNCLAHAELNLISVACKKYSHDFLKSCTIYTSDEPCPMCASAIYWSGIGKLTYGLSKSKFYSIAGRDDPDWVFEMSAREVLKKGKRKVEILGPFLEEEISLLHFGDTNHMQ